MKLAFDLDDCICSRPDNIEELGVEKYKRCNPIYSMIKIVNECYSRGHHITIYTARGMTTFSGDVNKIYSELYNITINHLNEWGVKFHCLVMGKLDYDLLIDDKAINSTVIKSIDEINNLLSVK
jgi:hypothetical protein